MLEIFLNNKKLDLFPDTEISYNMENPFVVADKVPVPYTLDFLLPKTVGNLAILGQPERVSSLTNFNEARNVEVRFCGFVVILGELVIMEVNQEGVMVNITGANIPKNLTKKLYAQNLGEVAFPYTPPPFIDTMGTMRAMNDHFIAKANEAMPDYVAAPCAIKGVEPVIADPEGYTDFFSDRYKNQRCGMINNYRLEYGAYPPGHHTSYYWGYYCSSVSGNIMTKIIPAFRIGFILKKLFNASFSRNVFDEELGRLMMLCSYHPTYNVDDDSLIGNVDRSTMEVKMRFADFMPDIAANDFLTEVLKIPCLTLFVRGSHFDIEFNSDILASAEVVDMNLIDGYTIALQKGEQYQFDITSDYQQDGLTEDTTVFDVKSVNELYSFVRARSHKEDSNNTYIYNVSSTNQTFRATPVEELSETFFEYPFHTKWRTHWKTQLLRQGDKQPEQTEEESEREVFDMSFNGSVCSTVLVDYLDDDGAYKPTFVDKEIISTLPKLYIPEIALEKKDGKLTRGSSITLGLYLGMQEGVIGIVKPIKYPQISHCGCLPNGNEVTTVMLTPEYLLRTYHEDYKAWIEKDKKIVKGSVILTPGELNQLDLRRKVHIDGRNFFIRNINITLTNSHILPADAEFIES